MYTYTYSETGSVKYRFCASVARGESPEFFCCFGYGPTRAAARRDAKRNADQMIHELEQARAAMRARDAALLAATA